MYIRKEVGTSELFEKTIVFAEILHNKMIVQTSDECEYEIVPDKETGVKLLRRTREV